MSLHSLVVKIVGDNKQFNETIANTEKKLSETTKGLETVANNMTSVGDSMTKGITLPLAAAGAVLLKIGTDFDDAYDKIRIGSGATGEALEGLKEDFKEVAKDSASSFDDISSAIADYNTRLGLTGKPLQELSKQITNVSRITGTDLNTNITQSAKLFNNWQIATEKQSKTLDLMFVASQQTGIGIDRLMTSVTEYGPILRGMGYDLESATALIAGFDKAGVNVQETLATMKIAMRNLAKEGFTDPQEALSMYIEKIENAGSSIEATRIAAELFGSRGGAVMGAAIREGRLELDDLIESLKTSKETINAVAEETDDWKENLTKLKNEAMIQLEPIANKVFDSLGRAVEGISPKIKELAGWFGNLTDSQTDNILKWGLLIAAIGPAISIIGRTTTGIIQLRNAILTLNTGISSFAANGSILAQVFTGLASGLSLFAAQVPAIPAFVEDMGLLKQASGDLRVINNNMKGQRFANYFWSGREGAEANEKIHEYIDIIQNLANTLSTASPEIQARALELNDAFNQSPKALEDFKNLAVGLTELKNVAEDTTGSIDKQNIIMEEHTKKLENQGYTTEKATELAKEYAESLGYETEATEELKQSNDELIDSIYKLYNLYQSTTESVWAFDDAIKNYNEVMANSAATDREKQEALFAAQDQWEIFHASLLEEQETVGTNIKRQEELQEEYTKAGLKAVDAGIISETAFINMAKQFNISSGEIIAWAGEMGIVLDETTKERIIKLGLDTSGFDSSLSAAINRLKDLDRRMGLEGFASGGIVGYKEGGIINKVLSASSGMITPSYDNGGILTMLHKNEVVLNTKQTRNLAELIFGLANTRFTGNQEYGNPGTPITIKNVIELDGNIIYEKTDDYILGKTKDSLIGQGIRR